MKAQVVLEVFAGERTPGQIAKAYGVHPNSIGLWRRRFIERVPDIPAVELSTMSSTVCAERWRTGSRSSRLFLDAPCPAFPASGPTSLGTW